MNTKIKLNRTVAIHQPNFLPWIGFFDKIIRADYFVFFDDVLLSKRGGSWTNRVPILSSGQKNWLTVPIDRSFSGQKKIKEIKIKNEIIWREKAVKTITHNYSKHPYFDDVFEVINSLIFLNEEYLSKFNIHAIRVILSNLGFEQKKIFLSSDLNQKGSSNELLINITKSLKSDTYMCGGGADSYQDKKIFDQNSIKLIYQKFHHPVYPQHNQKTFIEGLSIIDILMNLGWKKTSLILNNG